MYKISVPIRNATVTRENRHLYLDLLKRSKAERVFLTRTTFCRTPEEESAMVASLRENIAYFSENGIEAGIWVGTTIGHGVVLAGWHEENMQDIMPLVNLAGEVIPDTRCPLDPNFHKMISRHLALLATTGTKLILLDDDLRLSGHGQDFCCTCERHMKIMQELCGETFTREELRKLAFGQKANKYRHAWLKAQGDSLRELARIMRRAVDEVDPKVRLAFCSPAAVWDFDASSPMEMARILAGDNPPLARLHSAPYTAILTSEKGMTLVLENARAFASMAKDQGVELMAEGDAYPRPRSYIPSSYLELHDALIRADGTHDGNLKYMADYYSSPLYETGYFDRHIANLPLMEQISERFADGKAVGVRTPIRYHLLEKADFELGEAVYRYPSPTAGNLLAANSIPTTYEESGLCNAIFGEEARYSTEEELRQGAILDGIAAVLLAERGIDVGLRGHNGFDKGAVTMLRKPDGSEQALIRNGDCRLLSAIIAENAVPILNAEFDGKEAPFAYRYENADGQKFFVYLYDGTSLPKSMGLLRCYLHQEVLTQSIEWIGGERLPASCPKNPELYIFCKKNGNRLNVLLLNCYADSILRPVITLGKQYRSIEFLNCAGTMSGDTVTLDRPLPAFEWAVFSVEE